MIDKVRQVLQTYGVLIEEEYDWLATYALFDLCSSREANAHYSKMEQLILECADALKKARENESP